MTDVLTPEQRRRNMQNIHQKDTSIELCLRKALWKKGYRYPKISMHSFFQPRF